MSDAVGTRFATITLAGRPNAGKSTLLNALVGEPLALTSPKPQSTRTPVVGVRTEGDVQLVFVDPPGLLEPGYALQEAMLAQALDALARADAVLYLHPADEGEPPPLPTLLPPGPAVRAPVLTVVTKADLAVEGRGKGEAYCRGRTLPASPPPPHVRVSALTGQGLDDLLAWCRAHAPPGEFQYDPENLSTQPLRFFVEEFVREAAFEMLGQELPYAVAVEVDEFRETADPVYIRAAVYVERESQQGMVVGKGGRTIKALGARARHRIEPLLGRRVYLDLWVKVLPKWRRSASALRRLGFPVPARRPT